MSETKVEINRTLVGIITIGCFVSAFVVWYWDLDDQNQLWLAGFVRVGLLMSAFWLALPTRWRKAAWANVSPTTFIVLLLAIFLTPRWPRLMIPLILVLVVIGFVLRPRQNRSRPGPRASNVR